MRLARSVTARCISRGEWEPFAVTDAYGEAIVWLRRSADLQDAKVVNLPRPPRGEPEVAR